MARDAHGLVILSEEECLRLLVEHPLHVGRVAVITEGYPLVLPVNYRMDHGTVVFRTSLGTKLDAAARGAPLGVEVDDLEPAWEEGWSVVIRGRGEEVTNPAEIARLQRLPLHPWGPGDRTRFVRIQPETITGRRIA
jgi:uncharacterized protein